MNEHPGNWDLEVDVVVLGGGGAGLVAALSVYDHGAGEVLILEARGRMSAVPDGARRWSDLREVLGVPRDRPRNALPPVVPMLNSSTSTGSAHRVRSVLLPIVA